MVIRMFHPIAQQIILEEIKGLQLLLNHIPQDFSQAVERIINLSGRVVVSGIGKSGYIARKISASFASTGTPSIYVHPAEASHGDLGMIAQNDIVVLLSNSGETNEILSIINYCKRFGISIIGITMREDSTLALASDYLLNIPTVNEASTIDAPTTSAMMMLALGDALMVAVYDAKGFSQDDFKILHPGGKIGANLTRVSEIMHVQDELPIVSPSDKMSDVLIVMTKKRFGCAIVISEEGKILGIITDGDLRKHMDDQIISMKAEDIMSVNPKTIQPHIFAAQALAMMNKFAITSLLISQNDKLIGIVHVHDILRIGLG